MLRSVNSIAISRSGRSRIVSKESITYYPSP
jgi:hypothetical protein